MAQTRLPNRHGGLALQQARRKAGSPEIAVRRSRPRSQQPQSQGPPSEGVFAPAPSQSRQRRHVRSAPTTVLVQPAPPGAPTSASARQARNAARSLPRRARAGGGPRSAVLARRHQLTRRLDAGLDLLKLHMPFHESDHVLALAYDLSRAATTSKTSRRCSAARRLAECSVR